MGITEASKLRLEAELPKSETTRRKLLEYKERGDLTWDQIAALCGKSRVGVERFSKDQYHHTADSDVLMRQALESMFERFPLSVKSSGDGQLYETENIAMLRKWFAHCHDNRAMAVIYGPPGSQKTYGLKFLVAEFNRLNLKRELASRAFYVRCSVRMQPRDLLRRVCLIAGAPAGQTLQSCITGMRLALREYNVLLVIDEGQHLPVESLEALREIHDEDPRVGILLAGSHGLRRLFDQKAPQLEQWNSRIDAAQELEGVSEDRAADIIRAEMPDLGPGKLKALVHASRVSDIYRDGREYINVRRLFKNLHAAQAAIAQKGVTQ